MCRLVIVQFTRECITMTFHVQMPVAEKERIVEQILASNLDGILLCSPENVYYTSGLPAIAGSGNPILFALKNQLPFYVYIGGNGKTTLLCWVGATLGFSFDVDDVRSFFNESSARDELRDFLQETLKPEARIGVESTCPFAVITALQQVMPSISLTVIDDMLLRLRMVKSEAEIERMRRAAAIVEETVAELREVIRPGISRLWLIGEAKRRMIERGATGIGHATIAFGTSNPEIAFDETLEPEQLVTLDLGAVVDGYVSDNRRYLYTGDIPDDLRSLHATLVDIVEQLGQALQPGMAFADLYNLASEKYGEHGLPPFFINVGHSIGLQTEEAWITFDSPYTVQPGMVLNIELYSAYKDGSNVGDEETFLVMENGPVRLTQSDPAMYSVQT